MIARVLSKFVEIRPGERGCILWSFAWFFLLMFGYYVLRPVRESLATVAGSQHLNLLFGAVFIVMLVAIPIYSLLVGRYERHKLVPVIYQFFAVCLLVFALILWFQSDNPWVARCYFGWVGVYSLFVVTIFWSFLADVYSQEQSKRLFGVIAAGGSIGALAGSSMVSLLSKHLAISFLMIIPLLALQLSILCAGRLHRAASLMPRSVPKSVAVSSSPEDEKGGGVWDGFLHVIKSPYLATICVFILVYKLCGTSVYLHKFAVVKAAVPDLAARTQLFANIEVAINLLILALQCFVAGPLMKRAGIAITLVILPFVYAIGFAALGFAPLLPVMVGLVIAHRGFGFGLTNPAKETLFTVVSRSEKYKAKGFIDTVLVRGGDVIASNLYNAARGLGATVPVISFVMVPVALGWAVIAWILGTRATRRGEAAGAAVAAK